MVTLAASPKVATPASSRGNDAEDRAFDAIIRGFAPELLHAPDDEFIADPEFSADPFTPLLALRERSGAVVMRGADGTYDGQPVPNVWGHDLTKPHAIVVGHAAASEIGTDRARFANEGAYGAHEAAQGRTVNTLDGNSHRRMRRLFDTNIFGRKAITYWTSGVTAPTIAHLVARAKRMFADGEPVCGMRDLALPITYASISAIIGVPRSDLGHFVALGERAQSAPRDFDDAMAAVAEMEIYFREQLVERRLVPRTDMLTLMSAAVDKDGYRLSEDEVIAHCRFLLPGGIETTWRQTANTIMAMMLHPDAFRKLVADPSLIDGAVEECLRWAPSGFVVPRVASEDTTVAEIAIPAGASICTIQGVANRDPAVFDRAARFDIGRSPNPHLTFHTGVHFCMGQNLARFTFRETLRALAADLPTLELACAAEEIGMRGFGVRNPNTLPLAA